MELISREELINKINAYMVTTPDVTMVRKLINELPTIESRPKGVWVGIDEYPHEEWECINCGNIINTYMQDELEEHKYCHKCGADMRETETWHTSRGNVEMPKGLFDKIYEEVEE